MLEIITGGNSQMETELIRGARAALNRTSGQFTVIVPKQLTLQTELLLIRSLKLTGSFRLQVLSPERLCQRIFDQAGRPEGVRVDDRGRVMLVRQAAREARDRLTLYRGAEKRHGFSEKAARQLELLRQAGVTPSDLLSFSEEVSGSTRRKCQDLAVLLQAYEDLLKGRFQDGESEFFEAAVRASKADFLRDSEVWFFGFDVMPTSLHRLIVSLSNACPRVVALIPLREEMSDALNAYGPLFQSIQRLCRLAENSGAGVEVHAAQTPGPDEDIRHPEIAFLEGALWSHPQQIWPEERLRAVQLVARKNPREEAMFVAALARRLAKTRGFRWNEMLVVADDLDACALPLTEAFQAYGVPLFLSERRRASRHPLAECLLNALTTVQTGFRPEDMRSLMRSGYACISPDEADRLSNYMDAYGLRGKAFLQPLARGEQSEREALEPIRARLMEPLAALRDRLRAAETLQAQLTAIFGYLEDTNAYQQNLNRQQALADAGLRQLAGEEAQVWTRILGALDQMHGLLGEKKLPARELKQTLQESLDAAEIRPLPQSGDAVLAQPLERIVASRMKAIFFIGLTDRAHGGDEGLLSDQQKEQLSAWSKTYISESAEDRVRMRAFYVKSALNMVTDYICFSYPLSGLEDQAERPGQLIEAVRQVFPTLKERGGQTGDAALDEMLLSAIGPAANAIGQALSETPGPEAIAAVEALSAIPEAHASLGALHAATERGSASEWVTRETSRQLFGQLNRASVTRLERYAACPFAHYVQYGLKPQMPEKYELTVQSEGEFYHEAVRAFLSKNARRISEMTDEEAEADMDALVERLLEELALGPLGETAVSRAEKRRLRATARTAARQIRSQLAGSRFLPQALEVNFGAGGNSVELRMACTGGDCVLEGRIDRIDIMRLPDGEGGETRVVYVMDYKRGNRAPDPTELYAGVQLQLPIYMGAAARLEQAKQAGAYYFRVDEGIVNTMSRDRDAVEAERRDQLRMSGILPADDTLRTAIAKTPSNVFKGVSSSSGKLLSTAISADEEGFSRIVSHALKRAAEQVEGIRAGNAAVAPVRAGKLDTCQYCRFRQSCLWDESLDRRRIHKLDPVKASELQDAIK